MNEVFVDLDALWELIGLCRAGDFYKDYDESVRVLGDATLAMEALTSAMLGISDE